MLFSCSVIYRATLSRHLFGQFPQGVLGSPRSCCLTFMPPSLRHVGGSSAYGVELVALGFGKVRQVADEVADLLR